MQATLWFYLILGLLTIIPLILFNIRRVFVKKPPDPMKVNWARGITIVVLCVLIAVFLMSAYNATLHERYEITLERAAQAHAEYLIGEQTKDEFRAFLVENGTEQIGESFDQCDFGESSGSSMYFQLSSWCIPKYWQDVDGFEQVDVIDAENPVYVMYLLVAEDATEQYYTLRLVETEEGWKYDSIVASNEAHQKAIKMPTRKNGKWYKIS